MDGWMEEIISVQADGSESAVFYLAGSQPLM